MKLPNITTLKRQLLVLGWFLLPLVTLVLLLFFFMYRLSNQVCVESWARYAGSLQARQWCQEDQVHGSHGGAV
jgi:hypothetical protein